MVLDGAKQNESVLTFFIKILPQLGYFEPERGADTARWDSDAQQKW